MNDVTTSSETQPRLALWRLAVVLATAAAVCGMLIYRVLWINGTKFNHWNEQFVTPSRIYPAMLIAAVPAFAAQWISHRAAMLILLCISLLSLELIAVGIGHDPWTLDGMGKVVQSYYTTSYFTDAQKLERAESLKQWIGHFPDIAKFCHMHAREKAPGQILYYWAFVRFYGQTNLDAAAVIGGLGVLAWTTLGIPASYGLARIIGLPFEAARAVATYFALMPGFVAVSPMFDQVHASFTGLIVGSWLLALHLRGWKSYAAAAACGAITAINAFMAYANLTLGAMCALVAVYYLWKGRLSGLRLLKLLAAMLLALVIPYLLLWLWCGFDPIRMYLNAAENEKGNLSIIPVPHTYPHTLPADLKDFLLASGWMSLPLALMGLWRVRGSRIAPLVYIGVAEIFIVCVSGFLRAETARIWLFLQPLALVPIGVELAAWPKWARLVAFAALLLVTICITQHLVFVAI